MDTTPRDAVADRFARLMREHGPALSRLAFGYERVPSVREELIQEIALAIWRALPAFRGECSERTFVYRIAHNRGLTHSAQRRPAHDSIDDLAPAHEPIDLTPGAEDRVALADRRARLRAAIQTLPPAHREVVMLMLEDSSHAEIADVLGISEGNVAVRLTRARKALSVALEAHA